MSKTEEAAVNIAQEKLNEKIQPKKK